MTKFNQKCPGCGSRDITQADPAFCAKCDKQAPIGAIVKSGWTRKVTDGLSVTISHEDMDIMFPGLRRPAKIGKA